MRQEQLIELVKPYYDQPHRYYHTLAHVVSMIARAGDIAQDDRQYTLTDEQYIAIIFHDIVYVPGSNTNENESVKLMNFLLAGKVDEDVLKEAAIIIMETKHNHEPLWLDAELVRDLDLVGFADADNYDLTQAWIRLEFRHVNDSDFYSGRIKFLKELLEQHTIYYTDYFKEKYEDIARENIANEIKELEKKWRFVNVC